MSAMQTRLATRPAQWPGPVAPTGLRSTTSFRPLLLPRPSSRPLSASLVARAKAGPAGGAVKTKEVAAKPPAKQAQEEEEDEEEYEESWLEEKVEDAKETLQAAIAACPGPRVGSSGLPVIVALPASYFALTFVIAVFKTIRKATSPRAKRKRQVNKNAGLMESIDAVLLPSEENASGVPFTASEFRSQQRKFGFTPAEVVRKYLRYALNEKPFTPSLVGALIQFRRASGMPDAELAEVLNDIGQRTVKAKGRVMMDTAGMTEKGLQRKAAVQAFFTKLLYLAELNDFLSPEGQKKLEIFSIFGLTDEDVASIRITSLSSAEDLEKLDQALGSDSDDG